MSINDELSVLQAVEAFRGFGREHLRLLAFGSESRTVPEGSIIFFEGESGDTAILLNHGRVKIEYKQKGAPKSWEVGAPALFGENALFLHARRNFTLTAITACDVLTIRRSTFLRVLEEYPELAKILYARKIGDLIDFSRQICELTPRR